MGARRAGLVFQQTARWVKGSGQAILSRAGARRVVCLGRGLEAQRGRVRARRLRCCSYESWPFSISSRQSRPRSLPRPAAEDLAVAGRKTAVPLDTTSSGPRSYPRFSRRSPLRLQKHQDDARARSSLACAAVPRPLPPVPALAADAGPPQGLCR